MTRLDPPYPSISFVLSPPPPRNDRSSRLPAYRCTHMHRYHPYPRDFPGRCEDRLMRTVDYRYEDEPLWEEPDDAHRRSVLTCEELVSSDLHPYNDSAPPVAGEGVEASVEDNDGLDVAFSFTISGSGMSVKLAAIVFDILAAMRRRYRAAKMFFDAK
ncbi:hypothetical protein FKP32DRAFT_1603244 [Trametes sanguinea]|nr:hypothetical protein FKP32DRAFT_1603244 [Trametes sanguinea]